jgi:hypothetical protein
MGRLSPAMKSALPQRPAGAFGAAQGSERRLVFGAGQQQIRKALRTEPL